MFTDTSYDALSMDDIAKQARVAKGLIYYYFKSKRGYYLAIIEDSVDELVSRAAGSTELPPHERVHRTIDGYLRYAEHHQAAYRTIITGGVGFDAEVHAIREGVREAIIGAIAEGAWGSPVFGPGGPDRGGENPNGIPAVARLALLGWLCSVEGITLDWIGHQDPPRDTVRRLLARTLRMTLRTIEEFEPDFPVPPRGEPGPVGTRRLESERTGLERTGPERTGPQRTRHPGPAGPARRVGATGSELGVGVRRPPPQGPGERR